MRIPWCIDEEMRDLYSDCNRAWGVVRSISTIVILIYVEIKAKAGSKERHKVEGGTKRRKGATYSCSGERKRADGREWDGNIRVNTLHVEPHRVITGCPDAPIAAAAASRYPIKLLWRGDRWRLAGSGGEQHR